MFDQTVINTSTSTSLLHQDTRASFTWVLSRMNLVASVLRAHLPIGLKHNTEQKATLSPDIKQQDREISREKYINRMYLQSMYCSCELMSVYMTLFWRSVTVVLLLAKTFLLTKMSVNTQHKGNATYIQLKSKLYTFSNIS